jgi:hypothetical protein
MLRELAHVRQIEGEPRRRWFTDDYFDLIVWFSKKNRITGFQLCYDKFHREHAMTWFEDTGYTHHQVDDGEHTLDTLLKATPVLVPDGVFEHGEIARRFKEESVEIENRIADFVYEKITQYEEHHGNA